MQMGLGCITFARLDFLNLKISGLLADQLS